MLTKLLSIVNKNENNKLKEKNTKKLNIFLSSLIKSNLLNQGTLYMGLNQTTLTNNKILKFITLYSNILLKDIIKKIFFIFKLLVLPLFNFLIFIMNFIINLFFNKIIKIKIFRVKIQDIFYKILYLKQFLVFKKLLNKRKHSVDPRLRKIKIKLIRKENFKKLFIKHIERKRKIKLKKRQKYMITRKLRRKKLINKNLRSSRFFVSNNLIKFFEFEKSAFNFTNKLSDNIISVLYRVKFILHNIIRILRIFEKNKKINYAKKIVETILNKLNLFSKYFKFASKHLSTIENLNKLFKFLFFRNFVKLRSGKKSGKIYFKSLYKYYFFNSILLIFSFAKFLLLAGLITDNDKVQFFVKKLDIFFNFEDYIKQFLTNIRFI